MSFATVVSANFKAFLDKRIKVINIGKTTGKLRIAINAAELFALAAMAEINVNVMEKPMLPSTIAVQY